MVDCLLAQGVTHAFGVPGESYLAVLDGLHARREAFQEVDYGSFFGPSAGGQCLPFSGHV